MTEHNGYLINSKQIIKYCNWYLNNPLHDRFAYMYPDNDVKQIKDVKARAEHNPNLLLFGNKLSESIAEYTDTDKMLTNDGFSDGSKLDDGTTVRQYLNYLSNQILVPYSEIKKLGKQISDKQNAKNKRQVDKENQYLTTYNKKYDKKLINYVHMYANNHSKYSKTAQNFNYKKYLGNKEFDSDVNDGLHVFSSSIIPLLHKSTKLFPYHAKLNKALIKIIKSMSLEITDIDPFIHRKHQFLYAKQNMFRHVKMDIFEITAWLMLHKDSQDLEKYEPQHANIPKAPAFKSDLKPNTFFWDKKSDDNSYSNMPEYFTDLNVIADYKKLKNHKIAQLKKRTESY